MPPGRAQPPDPADPRPLRKPDRRGRARSVVACAAARRGRARDPQPPVARAEAGRARRACGAVHAVGERQRRRHVPSLDDLRGGARAPRRGARSRRRVGASPDRARLRQRGARRHGDDRTSGRLGCAGQHHARRADRGRRVRTRRPQVVLLVSAVRRIPGARAGRSRALVLPRRAWTRDGIPATQGQARHAIVAVIRGRVPRHPRPPRRRRGARRPRDHPDGQPHPARLPARSHDRTAPGNGRGDPPRPAPLGVRGGAVGSAGDAQRARGSRDRV